MRFFLVVALFFLYSLKESLCVDKYAPGKWAMFKFVYSKKYMNQSEEDRRFDIWCDNADFIQKHNRLFDSGKVSFKVAMNQFGDMTNNEFRKKFNGFRAKTTQQKNFQDKKFDMLKDVELPNAIDWRSKGFVTEVKDQGHCGSCWAFSSIGAIEGQLFKKTGKLTPLSEQNLIDCSIRYGNLGCSGGFMTNAYKYVISNDGIEAGETYPYQGKLKLCKFKKRNNATSISSFVEIPSGDEESLQKSLVSVGPIAVGVDASLKSFQFYSQGVFSDEQCKNGTRDLDHAILLVGFEKTAEGDFYILKNSWGKSWGENGYIKIAMNQNNKCGLATFASYPLI